MPILNDNSLSSECSELKADYIMNTHIVSFRSVEKLAIIKKAMIENSHSAFPVVN